MENSEKIILDLCGGTGSWSEHYARAGYDRRIITLPEYDVRRYRPPRGVWGVLAAPPCVMFSYARSTAKTPRDLDDAMSIVRACQHIIEYCIIQAYKDGDCSSFHWWALENPARSYLVRLIGKPIFTFQPYEYGDPWTKLTGLWGWFTEPLKRPIEISAEMHRIKKINSSKRLSALPNKFKHIGLSQSDLRSITPPGFARAFFEANP